MTAGTRTTAGAPRRALVVAMAVGLLAGLVGPGAAAGPQDGDRPGGGNQDAGADNADSRDAGDDPARVSVIVVFHDGVDPERAARDYERRHDARTRHVYEHALTGLATEVPRHAVDNLERDRRVDYVEADQAVTAMAYPPTGVDRVEADQNPTAAIDGTDDRVDVDVAVLDTGIAEHADLAIAGGVNCTKGPWWRCKDGDYDDGNGHGTHVAGTAAAVDDGAGVVGVAPGASLWAVKVLDDNGSGSMSDVVAGIDWVTDHADTVEVANMSLGCECDSDALDDALYASTDAGVVYAVAAGNAGEDAAGFSPANHPKTITLSAMADFDGDAGGLADPTCRDDVGGDDEFATFSNYGDVVDLAAPGVCITSTVPDGGHAQYSGTSMASPHGAGAAALYVVAHGVGRSSDRWREVRDGLIADWSVPQGDACGFTGGVSDEPLLLLADCDTADDGNDTPTVTITSPGDGAAYTTADDIGFEGSADDTEDGDLSGDLTWVSDLDGQIGTGASFTTSLSAGDHTVTAEATDADGATGSDTVGVTVTDEDGFVEDFEGDPAAHGWTWDGLWHHADDTACTDPDDGYASPTHSFYYGQEDTCDYDTGSATSGTLTSPAIAGGVTAGEPVTVAFDYWREVESYDGAYDRAETQVSWDGGDTWTTVWAKDARDASQTEWLSASLNLTAEADSLTMRFVFDTVDGVANDYTGWLIDDVSVRGS